MLHDGQGVENLHVFACPLILAQKALTDSSRSCFMLYKAALATMELSSLTAKVLIVVSTCCSVFPVSVPPAERVTSLLRFSSQHSRSCRTASWPSTLVACLYSVHLVKKYAQSSAVPLRDMVGRRTFSVFDEFVC